MAAETPTPAEIAEHKLTMRVLAEQVDQYFNGAAKGADRPVAFVILSAKFGQIDGGRVNYISNTERADTIAMLKEITARFEGRIGHEGETPQ